MNKNRSAGLLNAGLGLLIILTPLVLPVCQGLLQLANGKMVPMRCHWTAQAEILLGALILAAGLTQAMMKNWDARRDLGLQVAFLGLAVILTPLFIISTCTDPDMACNIGTKPALLILGAITLVSGISGRFASGRELGVSGA